MSAGVKLELFVCGEDERKPEVADRRKSTMGFRPGHELTSSTKVSLFVYGPGAYKASIDVLR